MPATPLRCPVWLRERLLPVFSLLLVPMHKGLCCKAQASETLVSWLCGPGASCAASSRSRGAAALPLRLPCAYGGAPCRV